jgi:hypothetical protein
VREVRPGSDPAAPRTTAEAVGSARRPSGAAATPDAAVA